MKNPMFKTLMSYLAKIGLFCGLTLCGCRMDKEPGTPPLPLSQKVSWGGRLASGYLDSLVNPDVPWDSSAPSIIHHFQFTVSDSLRLRLFEYREAYWAYSAFQKSANSSELAEGFYRDRNTLVFRHGNFVGELESMRGGLVPAEFLKEKLTFLGENLFVKPREFEAFPLLGRIPHTERVISRGFLGHEWLGPVFTVEYRCHGDSATAFRAFAQDFKETASWIQLWKGHSDTLDWGRQIHFQGADEFHRPLVFWVFPEGVMGFEGCYDRVLTQEYAQKMKKTAVFWPKP